MRSGFKIGRRGFIGAVLVAVGAAIGWVVRRFQGPGFQGKEKPSSLDNRFVYDVSEFEKTDPKLLLYEPDGSFSTGFKNVKRIELGLNDAILVAGDRSIKSFDQAGNLTNELPLERPPHCVRSGDGEELLVALGNYFEIYDSSGTRKEKSSVLGEKVFLTAIAHHEGKIYLADAGNREVIICDRKGNVLDRFGKKDDQRNNPGFVVPSPYFDLTVAPDDRLRIANPGRLRMETYTLDGVFESSWGQPGMQIGRFCGCCNPVYFTLTSNGGFITSEKGLARVNVYDANGEFKGAVAGPEILVEDKALAKRACADCTVGAGFDVALDSRGNVVALDPFQKIVRKFSPLART